MPAKNVDRITVSLDRDNARWVRESAAAHHRGNASAYVNALVLADRERVTSVSGGGNVKASPPDST